jgi:hypothetical protein
VSERKTQLSVFLEQQVLLAARQRAKEMKLSMSAVVADAAKESLLSAYRSEREQEILKAVERNFHALRRLDQRLALEIQILKEMVGLGMRSFFNHTTNADSRRHQDSRNPQWKAAISRLSGHAGQEFAQG